MINRDLLHAIADALGEELDGLAFGTCSRLPEAARRQAFYLALHREGRYRAANIALHVGRPYMTVYGILKAAAAHYDSADPLFFEYYQPASQACANWLAQNETEGDDA